MGSLPSSLFVLPAAQPDRTPCCRGSGAGVPRDALQRFPTGVEAGEKLRAVGNRLSPNGLGLSDGQAQVSPALLDSVLFVDRDRGRVTVQAGATVGGLLSALRPYGLTLENLASIADQQLGGFLQVGAHGTGAGLPPVDEQGQPDR